MGTFNAVRFQNAIKKAGLKIEQGHREGNFFVQGKGYYGTFYIQEDKAICTHVCANGLKSDSMTDYFPGYYPSTIKGFIGILVS